MCFDLAPFSSDAPVSPPSNGRRDERCSHEDYMDMMPPEHHMDLRDIAHVPTSVSDEDEDWSDMSVSSHVEMPVLTLDSEVVVVRERSVEVWGLPLTVCNSRFRSGASDGILSSEGMKWLCLLSSADVRTGEVGALLMDVDIQSLDHWRGTTACVPLLWLPLFDGFVPCYKIIDSRLGRMAGRDWDDTWGLPNNSLGSRVDMRPYYAL